MMNRSALIELLTRYQASQSTPEENQLIEQWYELLGEPVEIPLSEEQWLVMEQKLWRKVQPLAQETDDDSAYR
jgi:transmembrane sensor